MQTSGPMCRWEQAWWCCGRYHTGPQMGPCTVEPVAGAEAWALARWATLREAQPVRPKQILLLWAKTGVWCCKHTHTYFIRGIDIIMTDYHRLASFWFVCVCFHLWFHSCFNWKYQASCWFPMFIWENRFLISGQWFLPAFSQWGNAPCASWCIIQPIFSDGFFKASSEYYL